MTNQSLREWFILGEGKADQASRIIRETANAGQIKPDDPEGSTFTELPIPPGRRASLCFLRNATFPRQNASLRR